MNKDELIAFLKENLHIEAGRETGYCDMEYGNDTLGEIYVELWLGKEKINRVVIND